MKKILSILMCALLCVTLFVVPLSAYAEEHTVKLYSGTYTFNDDMDLSRYEHYQHFDLSFSVTGSMNGQVMTMTFDGISIYYYSDDDYYSINYDVSGSGYNVYTHNEWGASDGTTAQTITLSENQYVSYDTFEFIKMYTNYTDFHAVECDGTSCNLQNQDGDNVCDDCGLPFVWSLRNDTYDFNGYHFATTFELGDGSTTTLNELWAGIKDSGGNVFILNDTWENALFYIVSPADNMQVVGNSYQTKDRVVVTLYSSETTADGTPYWKYTATDTRNNAGANLGTLDQIIWTAENLNDQYGFVVVDGDINFMTPLWEKVEQVTQGTLPNLITTLGGNLMTLTLCGVGLIILLVGLYLLLKVLRTYLKT